MTTSVIMVVCESDNKEYLKECLHSIAKQFLYPDALSIVFNGIANVEELVDLVTKSFRPPLSLSIRHCLKIWA